MDLSAYQKKSKELFEYLQDTLDPFEDQIEYDFGYSKLTVKFVDKPTEIYVINTQQAALQIWVAGEALAWHFDWDNEKNAWYDSKNEVELFNLLSTRFSKLTGQRIDF